MIAGCASSPSSSLDGSIDGAGHDGHGAFDGNPLGDGIQGVDGTPTRLPCTSQLGSAMTTSFGRLDGFLVAIVPPGGGGCSADSSHVHLQVKANGAVYDFAVNVGSPGMEDVHTTTRDITLPGGAWAEGWHAAESDDYVLLGLHSSDLTLGTRANLTSILMTDLASANHITVFATGYGPGGGHLVHRNGGGHDGLIVTEPLSNPSHARMFSFTSPTF